MTHKNEILKELYFTPLHTTEIFVKLHQRGVSIGANSLTRRLRELAEENQIIGLGDKNHNEKLWQILRIDKSGQGVML